MTSAADVRHDAIVRLIELAGADRYDPNVLARRPGSLEVLRRRVLSSRNPDAIYELHQLWPLVIGDTAALIDATQEHQP